MFQPLLPWQTKLYLAKGDWYAQINPAVGKVAGDAYYTLVASDAPFMWDITPEVDLPLILGRTKETNIFTLDKLYSPLSKYYSGTVASGTVGNIQTLSNVSGLAIGDTLFFAKSNAYVLVTGIEGSAVTLSASVTTTTGDPVQVPQIQDLWAVIVRTSNSQLYGGVWYVQGNPQVFEGLMPHQALLLKRGNAGRGMPLS